MSDTAPTTPETLFIQASRGQLRIASIRGMLSVEDLWQLPLKDLDVMAVQLDQQVQPAGRKTFLTEKDVRETKKEANDKLALEILKFVIATRLEDEAKKKAKAGKAATAAFLRDVLKKQELAQLESLSPEEIKKLLTALEEDEG